MKTEKLRIFLFLAVGIFLISFVSSISSYSYQTKANSFNYNYGTDTGFQYYDQEMCQAGQDFIVQITTCEPAVVRSDLLEEQNVPVFCQLAATKINPLIDVEAIDYISFTGDYPQGVSGIGFHPAQAAVKSNSYQLLNSPVLNNIGYAVIVLKQNRNESSMPNSVQGTLTAYIRYDVQNAFGIGTTNYYLPEISDDEWIQRINQYSFWDGKGFIRAESVGTEGAIISIYEDEFDKIGSFNLEPGQTSDMIYIPGYYCMAGLRVQLVGVENPDTRVKLKVNDDVVEVADGEKFLDNNCAVTDIVNRGVSQSVKIRCSTDTGVKNFELKTSPQIKLDIGGEIEDYELGDFLYASGEKFAYLGYIGSKSGSTKIEDTFVWIAFTPEKKDRLSDDELSSLNTLLKKFEYEKRSGVGVINFLNNLGKFYSGTAVSIFKTVFEGETENRLIYGKSLTIGGKTIGIVNFAGAEDNLNFKSDNLKNAMKDYDEIVTKFSGEKQTDFDLQTFGERALFEQIKLADGTGQKKTMLDLCEKFEDRYPDSSLKNEVNSFCEDNLRISSSAISSADVVIAGGTKTISFKRVTEPSPDEFSAEVYIEKDGKSIGSVTLSKNEQIILDNKTGEYIQLLDLDEDSAEINIYVLPSSVSATVRSAFVSTRKNLKEDISESYEGYTFTLRNINLKKVAKVSLIPNINYQETEANFSFKIGIEKRAIQLSPEKISEKLVSLNETISKWEGINENLGKTVKGLKAACVATGTWLTLKNFWNNRGGKASARQEVMNNNNGWYNICKEKVSQGEYSTTEKCLLEFNDDIEKDIEQVAQVMENHEAVTEKNVGSKLENLRNSLGNLDENVAAALTQEGYNQGKISLSQTRDLEKWQGVLKSASISSELKTIAESEIEKILGDVKANSKNLATKVNQANQLGIDSNKIGFMEVGGNAKKLPYNDLVFADIKSSQLPVSGVSDDTPVYVMQTSQNEMYVFILDNSVGTDILPIKKVWDPEEEYLIYNLNTQQLVVNPSKELTGLYFQKYDENSYSTPIKNPEVRFFETEPYKGYPAIVPVEVKTGWYAVTQQIVSGGLRAYDDSGRPAYFYLCNVEKDGIANGIDSDMCVGLDVSSGQLKATIPGLDEIKSKSLVEKAIMAINEAQRAYQQGKTKGEITINGQKVKVGDPAANVPGTQCQDFMSPKDCNLLFNVCDPVICPSSRCDLGGSYPVQDVIQSGIVGSIALCAPNYKEGIYIPVCLTGLHAGIDSLLSVFKNYQDCLQYSLDTGEQVGICDQIHSIYKCEFFWRQAVPFTKLIVPKIINIFSGEGGTRGGGEYLNVLDAYNAAGESVDYLVQYYGANSYKAFQARSTEEVGTEFCKVFPSIVAGGNILDKLLEPDSPHQYTAWFSENSYTTATVPPISQYKVFYHIYAGNDQGAYYSVYLKSPSGTSFYYDNPTRPVATGYIPVGDYASETIDFTAPSGYKELCVNINGQDECGFSQVSSNFAVNYVSDLYVQDQVATTTVKTASECVSGKASLLGLTTSLNVQEGVDNALNPSLADLGITRICSTNNPGQGTDANWETNNSRWQSVGYCDNENIKCWLDTDSVKAVVEAQNIETEIIGDVASDYLEQLKSAGNYIDIETEKEKIENLDNVEDKITYITEDLISRAFYNSEKAWLLFERASAYGILARFDYNTFVVSQINSPDANLTVNDKEQKLKDAGYSTEGLTTAEIDALYKQVFTENLVLYPVFEFSDGKMKGNLFYTYTNDGWKWADNKNDLESGRGISVNEDPENYNVNDGWFSNENNKPFIISLREKSYESGLKLLVERTLKNSEGGWSNTALISDNVELSYDKIFTVTQSGGAGIYLKLDSNNKWKYKFIVRGEDDFSDISEISKSSYFNALSEDSKKTITSLEGNDIYEGAEIIFNAKLVPGTSEGADRRNINYDFKTRTSSEVLQIMNYAKANSVENRKCDCGNFCATYANFLVGASEKYGIPDPILLLSIMMQESSCNTNAASDSSIGLMQINLQHCGIGYYGIAGYYNLPSDKDECKYVLLNNPEKNIYAGAKILAESYAVSKDGKQFSGACTSDYKDIKYYNWEAALRGYVGWGCAEGHDNYVDEVMARYKELSSLNI